MDGNRAVVAASAVGDARSGVALVRHLETTKACHYVLMSVTGKGRGTIITPLHTEWKISSLSGPHYYLTVLRVSLIIHPGAVFVAVAVRAATGVHVAVAVDGGGVVALLLRLRRLCDALAQRVVVRRARSEEEPKVA